MEKLLAILKIEVLGNTLQAYLVSLLVFAGTTLVLNLLRTIFMGRLRKYVERTTSKFDDFILEVCNQNIFPILYVSAFYFAAMQLTLNSAVSQLVHAALVAIFTFQAIRLFLTLVLYFVERTWLRKEIQKGGTGVSKSIFTVIRVVFWGLGLVFLLDNLGFNVSAIVAGLGIGGIAVALAAQTILGDLFNYFVIFFDKPFREGDFIVTGDYMGVIENIGIKSTRIRALGGEEIIISNSNLTSSWIHNYKRMSQRRVEFRFQVSYATDLEQLKKIPTAVRQIIENIETTKFDRAHSKEFATTGFVFEAVYFVLDADFNKYMDIQQKINWEIKEFFEKEGIEFASPRQVLQLSSSGIKTQALSHALAGEK